MLFIYKTLPQNRQGLILTINAVPTMSGQREFLHQECLIYNPNLEKKKKDFKYCAAFKWTELWKIRKLNSFTSLQPIKGSN